MLNEVLPGNFLISFNKHLFSVANLYSPIGPTGIKKPVARREIQSSRRADDWCERLKSQNVNVKC